MAVVVRVAGVVSMVGVVEWLQWIVQTKGSFCSRFLRWASTVKP